MTRRSKSWVNNQGNYPVDNRSSISVDYPQGVDQPDKASYSGSLEGIKINADVWEEMITVGKLLCLQKDDPDLYDLFDWVRINLCSGQPYGDGLLARVDAEITKELGPWTST